MLPERCQGTFRYRRDGVLLGVTDTFVADGSHIRSTRAQPGGARMEVDATIDAEGLVASFEMQWTSEGQGQIPSRSVRYALGGGVLTSAIDDDESLREVDADAVMFPLLRIFQGVVILAVASAGEAGRTVIIPDLHDLTNPDRLLHPTVERRTATLVSTSEAVGRPAMYSYEGSVYDADARFFVDPATGLMSGYRFPQPDGSVFDVTLELDN